jgi:hypothetical protein
MKLDALKLGVYRLIIVISFWCISPFISMECLSLSHLINVGLTPTLSEISIATPAYFGAPCLLCYMSFFSCLLIIQLFFCRVGVSLSKAYADLSQGWLWEYHVPLICSPVGLSLPSKLGSGAWW